MKSPPIAVEPGIVVPVEVEAGAARWYSEQVALVVSTLKWALLGAIAGALTGLATRFFLWTLKLSGDILTITHHTAFPIYWALPVALPLSVWLVRTFAPDAKGHGTEAVIAAVHERSGQIDAKVAPIKLVATVVTIMFGGSVGKEGPCAQIGAAVTSTMAGLLRLSTQDRRQLVICGIGAGFAAVFGTPVSGAIFGIEVLYLGRIEYQVLFPCIVAGIVSSLVCGVHPAVPAIGPGMVASLGKAQLVGLSVLFGACCGIAALILIEFMRWTGNFVHRWQRRPYLVAMIGGVVLALIYRVFGMSYAGLGVPTIDAAMTGIVPIALFAWLVKILATGVTLEVGGSGGIVTPIFFIGSTLGWAFADVFHLPKALFASFGFIATVAAATNTPIALSIMGMELLPGNVGVYAALCACTAYLLAGHRSVYSSQRLGISKTAALEMTLGQPIGLLRPNDMAIRRGTITARIHRLGGKRIRIRRRGPGPQ